MSDSRDPAHDAADGGLEIGNHSAGHFSGYQAMLNMEDELLANHVPRPNTIAWPLGGAAMTDVPAFVSNGYLFARGGYSRPYRPTVDNGFDIPSAGLYNMPDFVKMVRQATGGKIVVIMYHGVPDMEHPPCTVEPTVFKEQMQYLKDNKYKVIGLRDLAEYVDPVKASKLPPTSKVFKESRPVVLAEEVKPYANPGKEPSHPVTENKVAASSAKDMLEFVMPGAGSTPISSTRIGVSVPINTDVTKLAPTLTASPLAQVVPASGTPRDFTKPQTYTVTAQDGSSQVYTVAVIKSSQPNTFTWGKAAAGNWSDASQWSNNLASGSAPIADGREDYVLTFNQPGKNDVTHDLADGFLINQLNLEKKEKEDFNLTGKSLTFVKDTAAGVLPGIIQRFLSQKDGLDVPIKLTSDIHVVAPERCFLRVNGPISGDGRLIYDGHGTIFDGGGRSNFSTLFIATKGNNTYSGGTIINGGRVWQYTDEPVTVSADIANSKGAGGGAVIIKKSGAGTLQLTGNNSYSSQTILESGTLSVASLNSVVKGKATSSLGAPIDIDAS